MAALAARAASGRWPHVPVHALSAATGAIEIGFCDSAGNGFFTEQPADQLERWSLPKDNGSHVVVHWSAAKKACGLNITSYLVDVSSSLPLLDHATRFFGAFPQDICAGDSKARKTVGRKTVTKKPVTRTTVAKKTVTKKPVAKKTTAKKTAVVRKFPVKSVVRSRGVAKRTTRRVA